MNKNKTYKIKDKNGPITIPMLARMLGISRVAVFLKVKAGEIRARKIGNIYAIDEREVAKIVGYRLTKKIKKEIERAVQKTVQEYGETLRLLGKE